MRAGRRSLVHDQHGHADVVAELARDVLTEPARDPGRERREHDLIDLAAAEGVPDGRDRIAVADFTIGLDALLGEVRQEAGRDAPWPRCRLASSSQVMPLPVGVAGTTT